MTEFDIGPSFLFLNYTTIFGQHSHIVPTRAWNPVPLTGTMGSYTNWAGATRDGEDMIDDLVAKMAPLHKNDTTYTLATIYNKPTIDGPSIPVASKALAVVGTSGLTTHAKAIQAIFSFRTDAFHPAKLTFLDVPHPATDFLKENSTTVSAEGLSLAQEFMLDQNAWSGRDGQQPSVLVSVTWNLNQALRKQYGMG
jgi:hypothetical protein